MRRLFTILQAALLWRSGPHGVVSVVEGFSSTDDSVRKTQTKITTNTASPPSSISTSTLSQELDRIEEQSRRAVLHQLDYNTVVRALDRREKRRTRTTTILDEKKDSTKEWLALVWNQDDEGEMSSLAQQQQQPMISSDVQVSLAASSVCSFCAWNLAGHNPLLSVFVFGLVFYKALQDPMADDSVWGAFARLLGRQTVKSYQASEPKLRALARAVITGEQEMEALQHRIKILERRNWKLRQGHMYDEDDDADQSVLSSRFDSFPTNRRDEDFEERSMPPAWVRNNDHYYGSYDDRQNHHSLVGALQSRGYDPTSFFAAMEQYGPRSYDEGTPNEQSTYSWDVANAAAAVASTLTFAIFPGNWILTGLVYGFVCLAAVEEHNDHVMGQQNAKADAAGSLARAVGKQTLQSYKASKPVLRALTSALVTEEEEIVQLHEQLCTLEEEHAHLKKCCRTAKETESEYSYGYLKQVAYNNGLSIAGNKMQLLIRIMEKEILPVGKR